MRRPPTGGRSSQPTIRRPEQAEIEDRLQRLASPFRTAESTGQDIVDPRDSRPLAVEFVRDAQRILARQLGPPLVPYRP